MEGADRKVPDEDPACHLLAIGEFLEAVVVMARLACGAGIRDLLLERSEIARARHLWKLVRFGRHLVHLAVEVRAALPDLGLRARVAMVGIVAEESLWHARQHR